MGGFWSCCRRDKSPEKAPLLPKSRPVDEPTHSIFEKLADIVGALNSGKFPSQDQVSGLLQHTLRSELLRDPTSTLPTHGGPLSQQGVALILQTRELVDCVLRIGLEKNYDNKLQDLLYQSSRSTDPVKITGGPLVDGSLGRGRIFAITSSAFRMLMSDILVTTREVVAEAAIEIGDAAAADVAKTAELDNLTTEGLKGKAEESYSGIQHSVGHAHRNLAAMSTILTVLHKYSEKLTAVAESAEQPVIINTQVDVSTPLYEAIVDLKVLLERFASGRSLDPLLDSFKTAIADTSARCLNVHSPIRSFPHRGWVRATLEELYDAGKLLLASEANAQWAQDVRLLVAEAQRFVHALESDVATQRFIRSLQSVLSALRRDALGWFVPRILKSLHQTSHAATIDLAVDALLLTSASTSASFAPDHIWVQNWNEIKVDMAADASPETSSKTRVHIDGMRCAAHGFGYYFKYKGAVYYSDEGVLDVDIGTPDAVGQGLTVDLEIETTQQERDTPGAPLFKLIDVNVSVPGLAFAIKHSKHWILNNVVLQPLAAPVVRLLLKKVLEQQITQCGWMGRQNDFCDGNNTYHHDTAGGSRWAVWRGRGYCCRGCAGSGGRDSRGDQGGRRDCRRRCEKMDRERFERRRGGWRSHAFDLDSY
ncbi:hypothetical protein B0H14DRAFT_3041168 [Mycena olivaceomarginata]|nr:hypothetical protein B0H14DRAFT_3041168 [Mycena olivaceomarginata]